MLIRIISASIILLATVIYFDLAHAHDAIPTSTQPLGWTYPLTCCSGIDCREVGNVFKPGKINVAETNQGYRISSTGEIIGYEDPRIKESPDGEFHWCSIGGSDSGATICLFTPPRGF